MALPAWAWLALSIVPAPAIAQPDLNAVGYAALVARLGPGNIPTGASVIVSHVEASAIAGQNAYLPDGNGSAFAGIAFTAMTQPALLSAHATNVGIYIYGSASLAPGVRDVRCWLADDWLTLGQLRMGEGPQNPPLPTPPGARVFNNSWIGTTQQVAWDNDVLRRIDLLATRDDVLVVSASGGASNPLLGSGFNGLAVATASGQWGGFLTPMTLDVPGRTKPEIVAPATNRSAATGFVAGAVTLLIDAANTLPAPVDANDAARSEVIKACLMTGATHRPTWTNGAPTSGASRGIATRPLDPIVGADTINVDQSHRTLTAGRRGGAPTASGQQPAPAAAWDYTHVAPGDSVFYIFALPLGASEAIITASWHRRVSETLESYTCANIDLELFRVDAAGALHPLTGPAGVGVFTGGNVASRSAVDNVEHLRIVGLAPGRYALEVRRVDALPEGAAPVAVAWRFPPICPGDADGNGTVDFIDLNLVLSNFGSAGAPASIPGDLDADGDVDFADLNAVLSAYGASC